MITLTKIEPCEITFIKVMAKKGANIFDSGKEAIMVAQLLKCMIKLYFNDKIIDVC